MLQGGNSKTLMLVNINAAEDNFHETLRASRFATRVSELQCVAVWGSVLQCDAVWNAARLALC